MRSQSLPQKLNPPAKHAQPADLEVVPGALGSEEYQAACVSLINRTMKPRSAPVGKRLSPVASPNAARLEEEVLQSLAQAAAADGPLAVPKLCKAASSVEGCSTDVPSSVREVASPGSTHSVVEAEEEGAQPDAGSGDAEAVGPQESAEPAPEDRGAGDGSPAAAAGAAAPEPIDIAGLPAADAGEAAGLPRAATASSVEGNSWDAAFEEATATCEEEPTRQADTSVAPDAVVKVQAPLVGLASSIQPGVLEEEQEQGSDKEEAEEDYDDESYESYASEEFDSYEATGASASMCEGSGST